MNLPHPTCARFTTSGSVQRLHDSTLTSERSWTLRFAWSSISPFVASSSSVPSGRSSPRPTHSSCGGTSGMWQIQLFYISCFAAAKAPLREAHAWRSLAAPHQPSNPHLLESRNAATILKGAESGMTVEAMRNAWQRRQTASRASTERRRERAQPEPRPQRAGTAHARRQPLQAHTAPGKRNADRKTRQEPRTKRPHESAARTQKNDASLGEGRMGL